MVLKHSRWVILAAALVGALLTARLGFWQLSRAEQKIHLQQAQQRQALLPPLTQAELAHSVANVLAQEHRKAVLSGTWLAPHTVYLENRQMHGRPGFYAVTPLALAGGRAVLVQRGWLPRDMADRTRIAAPPPPSGTVQVQGRIAAHPGRLFEFAAAASGPIRQNLDVAAFMQETGLPLLPLILVQDDPAGAGAASNPAVQDGLLRQWPVPAADVYKHHGYAFQWFALSALIIGLYVWFQLIRPRHQQQRGRQRAAAPV